MTFPKRFFLHSAVASLAAVAVLLLHSPASAQLSGEVSAQRLDLAPGAKNFLVTRALGTSGKNVFGAGVFANYGYRPIAIGGCDTAPCNANNRVTIPAVENLVTADVLASFVVIPALQFSAKIPVTWLNGQGIQADGTPPPTGLNASGLGDIQIEAKYRFYGGASSLINAGAYAFVGIPTGNLTSPGTYIGNASASAGGALIAGGTLGDLTWAANVGGMWREEAVIASTTIGPELRFSAALGYGFGPVVRLVADLHGGTAFGGPGSTNIEVDGGLQITPVGFPLTITAGGGAGVLQGIGTPLGRALVGVFYSFESRDRDHDGISDDKDACPTDPEDKDGFEDGDGCPEVDNDQDNIPDGADKCPLQPEDYDGFEDTDGCPEPDNDQDGIPDDQDQCKNEPETKNGFEDVDGCPDQKDSDNDGVPDDVDQCPEEPEDTDGYEDTDGCPDPDNDGDGIPDDQDECIDQPEDGKGKGPLATDGCPIDA